MLKAQNKNEGQRKIEGVLEKTHLLTLTFNSQGKVVLAKSGSKLTLPKNPENVAKNPDNTEW